MPFELKFVHRGILEMSIVTKNVKLRLTEWRVNFFINSV